MLVQVIFMVERTDPWINTKHWLFRKPMVSWGAGAFAVAGYLLTVFSIAVPLPLWTATAGYCAVLLSGLWAVAGIANKQPLDRR